MKLGNISKTNSKGQIVIPREFRKQLGIDNNVFLQMMIRGNGIYIKPVHGVFTEGDKEDSYEKILDKTRGTWAGDDSPSLDKQRRELELNATIKAKSEDFEKIPEIIVSLVFASQVL